MWFKMEFLLLNVVAFLKADENLSRHALKRTVDQLSYHMKEDLGEVILED